MFDTMFTAAECVQSARRAMLLGAAAMGVLLTGVGAGNATPALPPDVRVNSWAATAVQEVLANGVMKTRTDGQFHGEAKVTHAESVVALANLARAIESNKWRHTPSIPIPGNVNHTLDHSDWRKHQVTRYMLASLLARFGDYLNNGLTRAPAESKDIGKSGAFPPKVTVTIAASHPAYASLTYLAERNMIWPGSPFLQVDSLPVTSDEMSRALSEMAAGVTNSVTSLGLNADGTTPDASFHKKKSKP